MTCLSGNNMLRRLLIRILRRLTNAPSVESMVMDILLKNIDYNPIYKYCIFCGQRFDSDILELEHHLDELCAVGFETLPTRKVERYLNGDYKHE